MAEEAILNKFIKVYYSNLAYNPGDLRILYGANSKVKIHDMDDEPHTYQGKDDIMNGLLECNLFKAVANLEQGSIECIGVDKESYLLSVNGLLCINNRTRRFNQVFLLSQVVPKQLVFYIRTEILTLLSGLTTDSSEEIIQESQSRGVSSDMNASKSSEKKDMSYVNNSYETNCQRNYVPNHHNDYSSEDRVPREKPNKPAYEIIFAKNLPDDVTEDDVTEAFEKFGEINQVKMFPEKKYSTVSFMKKDTNYNVHEVYDRIMEECPEFRIKGELVRLEPFMLNHKKQSYDHRNMGTPRYHSHISK